MTCWHRGSDRLISSPTRPSCCLLPWSVQTVFRPLSRGVFRPCFALSPAECSDRVSPSLPRSVQIVFHPLSVECSDRDSDLLVSSPSQPSGCPLSRGGVQTVCFKLFLRLLVSFPTPPSPVECFKLWLRLLVSFPTLPSPVECFKQWLKLFVSCPPAVFSR